MRNFLDSLSPEDILALLVVVCCLLMKICGKSDNASDQLMTSVITYRLGSHAGRKSAKEAVRR
jgi:hypothetical protein